MGACDAIDLGMRMLMCKIIDKDYKYNDFLSQPFNIQNDSEYLWHFCNKLRVNVLIVSQNAHNYVARSDMNKSPLVAVYQENENTLSVLYHREYIQYEQGNLVNNDLDRFPFVYDPRAAAARQTPSGPASAIFPGSTGARPIKKIPNVEENKQEPVFRSLKRVPTTEENKQEADPSGTRSLNTAQKIEENKQNPPATNEVCKRLISGMASIIFLNNLENYNDEFIRDLNDYTEMDPSANIGDVRRLKDLISKLRIPPPQNSAPQVVSCGHPLLKYTSFCGNEHCAYCLKEIIDRDKLKAMCEHKMKIPIKNVNEINKLIESSKQTGGVTNTNIKKPGNAQDFRSPNQMDEMPPDLGGIQGPPPNVGLPQELFKVSPMQMQFKATPMQQPPKTEQEPINDSPYQEPPKVNPIPDPPKKAKFMMPTTRPGEEMRQGNFPGTGGAQVPGRLGPIQNISQPQNIGGNSQPPNIMQLSFKTEDNKPFPRNSADSLLAQPGIRALPSQFKPFNAQQPPANFPPTSAPTQPQQFNIPTNPPRPMFSQDAQQFRNPGIPSGLPQQMYQQPNPQPRYEQNQSPYQAQPQIIASPSPANGRECAFCKQIKTSDNFSFSCTGHEVCNVCRIRNMEQCVVCERFYSGNQKEELGVIAFSLS
mmetsp:Transcript_23046/g.22794  ORF Transcript_23046/g.22794 Transcript_23046/m.22794 type:complete len:649 (+) Transcript_23046:344-2290(+)